MTDVISEVVEKGEDGKIYLVRTLKEKIEMSENWIHENERRMAELKLALDSDTLKFSEIKKLYYGEIVK